MFYKRQATGITTLIVYVDDIILTSDNREEIHKIKMKLAFEFEMKDLGNLRFFLSKEVARNKTGRSIYFSTQVYS